VRTFYNVLPKSGTHIIQVHRNLLHKHIGLYDDNGQFLKPERITAKINGFHGDCTGHIPYSNHVESWLVDHNYRHVFIYRDLRDVALSLSEYVKNKKHQQSEFNVLLGEGKRLSDKDDVLLWSIYLVGKWWELFKPWVSKADSVYTFEELRGAALLLGKENKSVTFRTGQKGGWQYKFQPHHRRAAEEVF
jgi:hypothetical protein